MRLDIRRLGRLPPTPFYQHVYQLTLATVVSQLLLFAASVVLARLYTPRQFGEFSIALSVSSVLATVATMRLESAVPLADDDREAAVITAAALWCVVVTAAALAAGLAVQAALTGHVWEAFGAGQSVWLVPPMVAALGCWTVARMLQSRRGHFSAISTSSITSSTVQGAAQLAGGPMHLGSVGLSAGYIAGRLWNAVSLLRGAGVRVTWWPVPHLRVVARWRRFALLLMAPAVLNMISVGAVAPFVATVYGVGFSGIFSFAVRILALPSALLGQAVSTVFYPKAAEMDRAGTVMARAMHRATTGLLMVAVPTFGLVMLLGPELFGLIFGAKWQQSGTVAAILAPWLATSFIASPLSGLMTVKNQLGRLLVMSAVETSLRLGTLSLGVIGGRPMVGTAAYAAAGVLISVYYVGWSLRLSQSGLRTWARGVRGYLVAVSVAYPALLAVKGVLPPALFALAAAGLTLATLGQAVAWLGRVVTARGQRPRPADIADDAGGRPASTAAAPPR